jgi:hypothetical protein
MSEKFLPFKKPYIFIALSVAFTAMILQLFLVFSAENAGIHAVLKLSTFFTINSNMLLLISYLMLLLVGSEFWNKNTTQTALLTYLSFVCIVYHVMLQDSWNPQGMQWFVAELFHWVNPLIFLLFWLVFVNKTDLSFKQIGYWLIFPTVYFIWVLIYGAFGNGYPYPFLNVEKFGLLNVIMTGFVLLFVLTTIAALLILIGKNLPVQNVHKTDPAQNNSY